MKNLRIGTQLTIGFFSVLLLMVITALIKSWRLCRRDYDMIWNVVSRVLVDRNWLLDPEDETEINRKIRENRARIQIKVRRK